MIRRKSRVETGKVHFSLFLPETGKVEGKV
jgi:hypothetical protein